MEQTEAELESFRQRWKQEVTQKQHRQPTNHDRNRKSTQTSSETSGAGSSKRAGPPPATTTYTAANDHYEDAEPKAYHDLDERDESGRRLDETEDEAARHKEPESALEHYEKAVEREGQGNLGDSVKHYRQAFKLDPNVNEQYKDKHFKDIWKKGKLPAPAPPPANSQSVNPSNASVTVPNTAHHSLQGLSSPMSELLTEFSNLAIVGEEPPTNLSPTPHCPIASMPEELLIDVLLHVALVDLSSFAKLALVCKRLAYLVLTEDRIWKRITCGVEYGFASQLYRYACKISGRSLRDRTLRDTEPNEAEEELFLRPTNAQTISLPLNQNYPTYRQMFRQRARIRFNGCYISTVNYVRPGGTSSTQTHNTWTSPVHIVTYYRYLRFFRDGSVVSLLTVAEPRDVVHHLSRENLHKKDYPHGIPGAAMKDALSGRWRLSGPADEFASAQGLAPSSEGDDEYAGEVEGDIHIETEGVVPKYNYRLHLGFGSAGRGSRNNKLSWKGYWSYNKLTDDWAEFGRKNERAFYWSRVRSYGSGL